MPSSHEMCIRDRYKETYKRFLPYINNNYDFAEMLSEMLGELNGSHTGARYYASGAALTTAALGVFLSLIHIYTPIPHPLELFLETVEDGRVGCHIAAH